MPRYHFHVCDGVDFTDDTGTELAGIEEARRTAIKYASDLLASPTKDFWDSGEWKMRVTNAEDLTLFELNFFATNGAAKLTN